MFCLSLRSLLYSSLGGGCDNQISEPAADEAITFTQAPIIYPNSKGNLTQSKKKPSGARYYCLVSTLNPEGTEFAYIYRKYDLTIPKGLLKQARRDGLDDQWVTFALGSKYAAARTEADPMEEGGALVRMARCRMPASTRIIDTIERSMNQFGPNSWVDRQHNTQKSTTHDSKDNPGQSEIVCTEYTLHWICQEPGVTDPANTEGCVFISAECTRYEVISDGGFDGGGGGDPEEGSPGGGPSGDNGDMCQPDSSGGGGTPGLMGTGGGLTDPNGVPVSCSDEEPNPCDQVEELENDTTWVGKLKELQEAANNKNYETGYLLYSHIGGGYAYSYGEGSPSDPKMSLTPTLNIDGYIHSHYSGTYSTFSGQDIRGIYQAYQAGKISNLKTFTAGVVTSQGTQYLLKIENPQAFLSFGQQNLASKTAFESFESDYNTNIDILTIFGEIEGMELSLIDLLKTKNAGIKIFKGNSDFSDWQAIKNNSSNTQVVNSDCN